MKKIYTPDDIKRLQQLKPFSQLQRDLNKADLKKQQDVTANLKAKLSESLLVFAKQENIKKVEQIKALEQAEAEKKTEADNVKILLLRVQLLEDMIATQNKLLEAKDNLLIDQHHSLKVKDNFIEKLSMDKEELYKAISDPYLGRGTHETIFTEFNEGMNKSNIKIVDTISTENIIGDDLPLMGSNEYYE